MAETLVRLLPLRHWTDARRALMDYVPRCAACHHLLPWVVDTDRDSFGAELAAAVPVVIDFWAPWCGPCRTISPALVQLARPPDS